MTKDCDFDYSFVSMNTNSRSYAIIVLTFNHYFPACPHSWFNCKSGLEFLVENFFVHWELHSGFCNVVETGHCGVFFVVLFVIPGLIYEKTLMGLSYKIREDFILSLF